jgi:hypothetical protein
MQIGPATIIPVYSTVFPFHALAVAAPLWFKIIGEGTREVKNSVGEGQPEDLGGLLKEGKTHKINTDN